MAQSAYCLLSLLSSRYFFIKKRKERRCVEIAQSGLYSAFRLPLFRHCAVTEVTSQKDNCYGVWGPQESDNVMDQDKPAHELTLRNSERLGEYSVMGCETKLNRALIRNIVELVWLGFAESEIRQQIDLSDSTWNDWKWRRETDTRGIFHEFFVRFNHAVTYHSLYVANNARYVAAPEHHDDVGEIICTGLESLLERVKREKLQDIVNDLDLT